MSSIALPETLSPDSWSTLVSVNNVLALPPAEGSTAPGLGAVRPVKFVSSGANNPRLQVCDAQGNLDTLPLGFIPHLRSFSDIGPEMPEGSLATFRHRKGGQSVRERFLRILRITADQDNPGQHPITEIRFGEHPDHLGEKGYYIGAQHLGHIGLDYAKLQYLPPDEIVMKYFPISQI